MTPRTMNTPDTPMMAAVTAATTATRRVRQPGPGIVHIYTPRPGRVPAQPLPCPPPPAGEGDQGPITLVVVVVADDDAGVASRRGGGRPFLALRPQIDVVKKRELGLPANESRRHVTAS